MKAFVAAVAAVALLTCCALSRAGAVSASTSILFVGDSSRGPYFTLSDLAIVAPVGPGTELHTSPLAPPNTYVEVSQGGRVVAGCWSDASGRLDLLLPEPVSSAPVTITYRPDQSLYVDFNGIHRLTRGLRDERNASFSRTQERLWAAVEAGEGNLAVTSWAIQAGTRTGGEIALGSGSEKAFRPQPIDGGDPAHVWVMYDALEGSQYFVHRRNIISGQTWHVFAASPVPHDIAGSATANRTMDLLYSWQSGGATWIGDYTYGIDGSGGSGQLNYITGPPNLSHLSAAHSSDGRVWVAGEDSGRVYLYRGNTLAASASGRAPSVARVVVSGQERILFAYMREENGHTVVHRSLHYLSGFLAGSAKPLFTIPAGQACNLSVVPASGECVWLFWDQPFYATNQMFFTQVAIGDS